MLLPPGALTPVILLLAAPEAPEVDGLLRQAKGLRYAQRWYEAAAVYRRILATFPKSPRLAEARFWLAATLEQDQRWDEASDAYTDFLQLHPDQRMLVKEAKLNRVRCWGIRQGQNPQATPGLESALNDDLGEVQVASALQLARRGDRRGADILQKGLRIPTSADACRLALASLRIKPQFEGSPTEGRFLVLLIRSKGKPDVVRVRIAMALARAVGGYLTDEQVRQAKQKGVDLDGLLDTALASPKGSILFSVEDKDGGVTVQVE
jgi:tetratricopeptide (TPR) repeat protein